MYYRYLLLEWGRDFLTAPALPRYMATLTGMRERLEVKGAKVLFLDRNLGKLALNYPNEVLFVYMLCTFSNSTFCRLHE
jgi:hypothetical protein